MFNLAMFDTLIVPQGAEYQAVNKAISQTTADPTLIKIPIGSKNITSTLEQQKFWQGSPKKVLMLGLCGSLTNSFAIGEAVLHSSCQSINSYQKLTFSSESNAVIQQKLSLKSIAGLTSDRVINSVQEKKQLAQQYNCDTVDMENYGYLELLQSHQIQLTIIRVISDDLTFDLPNLDSAIDSSGGINPLTMTATMLKNPLISLRFIRNSLNALKHLEKITYAIFS